MPKLKPKPTLSYSTAVLRGAMSRGWTEELLASAAKLTLAQFNLLLAGERELTDRQEDNIERATGLTCGQLAARFLEPKGGRMTEITEELAKAMPISRREKSKPRTARRARL
jgi:hypothetical protein